MTQHRQRKCRHCGDLFRPDPRNRHHQRYCSKPACRKASKTASQHLWLGKPRNRDYFRGAANVERVRAWRTAHPGYWHRPGAQNTSALQADSLVQPVEAHEKSQPLTGLVLQDLLCAQPVVLIGLIANLTGRALQEDIARTARRLRQLGQDIVAGAHSAEGGCDAKNAYWSPHGCAGSPASSAGWISAWCVITILPTAIPRHWRCTCFLVTVADARGLSFYADASIGRLLSLSPQCLEQAREVLVGAGLIAYEAPLYQVLGLEPAPTPPPPVQAAAGRAAGELRSMREILRQSVGRET